MVFADLNCSRTLEHAPFGQRVIPNPEAEQGVRDLLLLRTWVAHARLIGRSSIGFFAAIGIPRCARDMGKALRSFRT